jgi:hypothetical protein
MDADAWANKGFLKTAVNLGIGTLEIYTLHTLSGNDFKDHSDDDLTNRKFNQIQQLLDSIQPQHNQSPKNVRLICGDLNLGAFVDGGNARSRAGKYQRLIDAMSAAGFIDAWNIWNGPSVERGTFDDADVTKRTNTCSFEDGQQLCQVFGSAAFQGKAKNSNANGQCYDYIFIERPVPSHAFHLDVTRVRRRPLKRVNPTEGIAYSSDHMGLDVGLVASPT